MGPRPTGSTATTRTPTWNADRDLRDTTATIASAVGHATLLVQDDAVQVQLERAFCLPDPMQVRLVVVT
jgi:hypothetical protein